MSSSLVQLFLLALISIVTVNGITRLTNGNTAMPGEYPFLASIRIKDVHICGGSIINAQFILTAGHCLRRASNINDVTVVTGSVQLSQGGFTSKVAKIKSAAGDGANPDTDIGLIKVRFSQKLSDSSRSVMIIHGDQNILRKTIVRVQGFYTLGLVEIDVGRNLNGFLKNIKLATPLMYDKYTKNIEYTPNLPNMDDFGTVIGWGSAGNNESIASDSLRYQYVYITDMSCNVFNNTRHTICTNNGPPIGVCYGDSGSPLVYMGKVVGVVSRAVLCGKGLPDFYSSVAYNINFIRLIINTL